MHDGEVDEDRPTGPAQLLLGSLLSASRWLSESAGRPEPEDDGSPGPAGERPTDVRYVLLGATSVVEDRLRGAAGAAIRVGWAAGRPVATRLVPSFVRRPVSDAVRRLDAQGRAVAETGAEEAGRIADALAEELARDPLLIRTIEEVVELVQWHIIDDVLPGVIDRLAADPEQIRGLVQGQSKGMAEELARNARSKAVAGDDAVDRVLARLLRRRPRQDGPGRVAPTPELTTGALSPET